MGERKEALFKIIVLIVSGIILGIWGYLVGILSLVHWIMTLISGRRNKSIAEFLEYWNTESYKFYRYITGMTNDRPFPFSEMSRISKFKK